MPFQNINTFINIYNTEITRNMVKKYIFYIIFQISQKLSGNRKITTFDEENVKGIPYGWLLRCSMFISILKHSC